MKDSDFLQKVSDFHQAQDAMLRICYDPQTTGYDFSREWLVKTHIPQGLSFMVDAIPFIMRAVYSTKGDLRVLDAGCAFGPGTELLAILLSSIAFQRKCAIDVEACDSHPASARYHAAFNRHVDFFVGKIEDVPDKSYDIVTCSNVLEHYANPAPLIEKLRRIARHRVVISVPFMEPVGHYSAHLFCFTKEYIEALHPVEACYETPVNKQACFVL